MKAKDIQRIAVVGAGLMGHGIALELALAGYDVRLSSRSQESLRRASARIGQSLEMLVDVGTVTREQADEGPARISLCAQLAEAVSDAHLVIEAVYEDLPLKQRLFSELGGLCREETILASTTSAFLPDQLTPDTLRAGRVVVAHYINPPYLVPLVEIVPSRKASEDDVAAVYDLLTGIGKSPIVLRKGVPGFVSGRLQMALAREAFSMVQGGVASPEDIDLVLRTSVGRRWAAAGVFEVFDLAGWDLVSAIASELMPTLDGSPEVPEIVTEKVARSALGAKTGEGFYQWTPESAQALRARIAQTLARIDQWSRTT